MEQNRRAIGAPDRTGNAYELDRDASSKVRVFKEAQCWRRIFLTSRH